jgi:hypothetical protein
MSKLNFASINEAYTLGSDQIKNTQEEIAKLKTLLIDQPIKPETRIGPPDKIETKFDTTPIKPPADDDFEYHFIKAMKHPKFEDIVKNYVSVKYPNLFLKETDYAPQGKESFGNKYSRTVCSDIKNYIVFFIMSMLIYLFLSMYLNSKQS